MENNPILHLLSIKACSIAIHFSIHPSQRKKSIEILTYELGDRSVKLVAGNFPKMKHMEDKLNREKWPIELFIVKRRYFWKKLKVTREKLALPQY